MFSDAALQSIAFIILGTTIRRTPELNKNELYAAVDFDQGIIDPNKYEVCTTVVGTYLPGLLVPLFDEIVIETATVVRSIVTQGKVVAGTLRAFLRPDGVTFQSILMWVQERK